MAIRVGYEPVGEMMRQAKQIGTGQRQLMERERADQLEQQDWQRGMQEQAFEFQRENERNRQLLQMKQLNTQREQFILSRDENRTQRQLDRDFQQTLEQDKREWQLELAAAKDLTELQRIGRRPLEEMLPPGAELTPEQHAKYTRLLRELDALDGDETLSHAEQRQGYLQKVPQMMGLIASAVRAVTQEEWFNATTYQRERPDGTTVTFPLIPDGRGGFQADPGAVRMADKNEADERKATQAQQAQATQKAEKAAVERMKTDIGRLPSESIEQRLAEEEDPEMQRMLRDEKHVRIEGHRKDLDAWGKDRTTFVAEYLKGKYSAAEDIDKTAYQEDARFADELFEAMRPKPTDPFSPRDWWDRLPPAKLQQLLDADRMMAGEAHEIRQLQAQAETAAGTRREQLLADAERREAGLEQHRDVRRAFREQVGAPQRGAEPTTGRPPPAAPQEEPAAETPLEDEDVLLDGRRYDALMKKFNAGAITLGEIGEIREIFRRADERQTGSPEMRERILARLEEAEKRLEGEEGMTEREKALLERAERDKASDRPQTKDLRDLMDMIGAAP